MNATIMLDAKLVGFAARFMAVQDIRYYLNGINVRKCVEGGVNVIATDGRRMVVCHDPDGVIDEERIIAVSPQTATACRDTRGLDKKFYITDRALVAYSSGDLFVHQNLETHVQAGNPFIEGKFPRAEKVVPSPEKLKEGAIGPFDWNLAMAFSKWGGKRNPPTMYQDHEQPNSAIVFLVDRNIFGLLMPMRVDGSIGQLLPQLTRQMNE